MNYQVTAVGGWNLIERLGEGSYGTVYLAKRKLSSYTEEAAIKHISIPKDEAELNAIREEHGPEESSVLSCLDEIRDQIVGEYQQMHLLQGHTNIVACHDIECCPKQDGPGYDIYIRMELLESVSSRITAGKMNREETIKLGMDICRALMLLSQQEPGIIHRDIKPQNLFVNANGDYKLGDFGTARRIAGTSALMSVKGTYAYMAPEVMNNQPVSFAADIYSLGLVMYRLMNENRAPFVNQGQGGSLAGSEASNMKRLQGVQLPAPAKADRELAGIILKACAFEPRDRWQSAEEMLSALEILAEKTVQRNTHPVVRNSTVTDIDTKAQSTGNNDSGSNNRHYPFIAVLGALFLLLSFFFGLWYYFAIMEQQKNVSPSITAESTITPEPVRQHIGEYHIITYEDGTCTIERYEGTNSQLYIPGMIDTFQVTAIGDKAFFKNTAITYVYIPSSVTYIGDSAFSGCALLRIVDMPNSVIEIGDYAFQNCCAITEINLPEALIHIGEYAFSQCRSLEHVSIPDTVRTIGSWAFWDCASLKSVILPRNMPYVSDYLFYSCTSLENVHVPETVLQIGTESFYNCWVLKSIEFPIGLTHVGNGAFMYCNSLERVVLPDDLQSVGDSAFYYCTALSYVHFPSTLCSIGRFAFYGCQSLMEIALPSNVTSIGVAAFANCQSLEALYLDARNEFYYVNSNVLFSRDGRLVTYPAGLSSLVYIIPNEVTIIEERAFDSCIQLETIVMPNSIQQIESYAFISCRSLESLTVPSSVKKIGPGICAFCFSMTELFVDSGNSQYYVEDNVLLSVSGELLCYPAGLERELYCIPDKVTCIGDRAFAACRLHEIRIPSSTLSIETCAFYDCTHLECAIMPPSISSISDDAFHNCLHLTLGVDEGSYSHLYALENNIPCILN